MVRLALSVLALTAATSALAQNYDGTWRMTGTAMPKDASGTAKLSGGRATISLAGKQNGKPITMTAIGRYVVSGKKLTFTFTDAKVDSPAFTPAQRKQMQSSQVRAQIKQQVTRQSTTGTVRWLGKNKFVLTEKDGKQTTFTRTSR